jgi:hypothetical protein
VPAAPVRLPACTGSPGAPPAPPAPRPPAAAPLLRRCCAAAAPLLPSSPQGRGPRVRRPGGGAAAQTGCGQLVSGPLSSPEGVCEGVFVADGAVHTQELGRRPHVQQPRAAHLLGDALRKRHLRGAAAGGRAGGRAAARRREGKGGGVRAKALRRGPRRRVRAGCRCRRGAAAGPWALPLGGGPAPGAAPRGSL